MRLSHALSAALLTILLLLEPTMAQQQPTWSCDPDVNWVVGLTAYAQTVIDHENTDGVLSFDAAIARCKSLCTGSCTGFFYQQHTNTHQICGFFESALSSGTQVAHGHREGAVCEVHGGQQAARGTEPAARPPPPVAEQTPDEQCFEYCLANNYCCNDHLVGSNQLISCAQACMVRARGSSLRECNEHCAAHAAERGCSRTINGHTYSMCQSCADLGSHCGHGVQAGSGACETGCARPVDATDGIVAAEFCNRSLGQMCRMRCRAPECPAGQCAMRQGNCCEYSCTDMHDQMAPIDHLGGNFCRRVTLRPTELVPHVAAGWTDWGVHLRMPGLNGTYRQIGIFKYGFFVRKEGFRNTMGSENWPAGHAGLQEGRLSTFWIEYTQAGVLSISEGTNQQTAIPLYEFTDPHSSILPVGLTADSGYHCTMATQIAEDCVVGDYDDHNDAWRPLEVDRCLSPVTYLDYESVAALDMVQFHYRSGHMQGNTVIYDADNSGNHEADYARHEWQEVPCHLYIQTVQWTDFERHGWMGRELLYLLAGEDGQVVSRLAQRAGYADRCSDDRWAQESMGGCNEPVEFQAPRGQAIVGLEWSAAGVLTGVETAPLRSIGGEPEDVVAEPDDYHCLADFYGLAQQEPVIPHLFSCVDDPTRCRCPSGECVGWRSTVQRMVGTRGGCPRSTSSCHSVETNDNEQYDHILEGLQLGQAKTIIFSVKATNDAHLGFFSSRMRTSEVYEIVLSGWGNTRSAIRESNQGANRVEIESVGLLSGDEHRAFWASAVDGLVQVGQGHLIGQRVLMQWQDPQHHVAMFVGLMTGFGSSGRWRVCNGDGTGIGYDDAPSFWDRTQQGGQSFNGTHLPSQMGEWDSDGQWEASTVLSASPAAPASAPVVNIVSSQSLPVITRAPPPPPPPPPVVVEVVTQVYSVQKELQAATEVSAAAASFAEDEAAAEEVQVASMLAFPVAIEAIAEGSPARQQFEIGFRVSMASNIGGGRAIAAEKIVIDRITGGGRRHLQQLIGSMIKIADFDSGHGRRRLQTVDVYFYIAAPAAVASQAASLVTTLAATSTSIVVTVGGQTLSADASNMAPPTVMQVPDVDCVGSWSGCGPECGTKFFVYTVTPSGGGATCSHPHGDATVCTAGEGGCVVGSTRSVGTTEVNTMLLAMLVGAVCALSIIALAALAWLCHKRSKVGGVLHVRPATPQEGVYTVQGTVVATGDDGWTVAPDVSHVPVVAGLLTAREEACPVAQPFTFQDSSSWGGGEAGTIQTKGPAYGV